MAVDDAERLLNQIKNSQTEATKKEKELELEKSIKGTLLVLIGKYPRIYHCTKYNYLELVKWGSTSFVDSDLEIGEVYIVVTQGPAIVQFVAEEDDNGK